MKADLNINGAALADLKSHMLAAANAIGQIGSGAYVTQNVFVNSRGSSAEAYDALLASLVKSTSTVQLLAARLADYFAWVFDEVEQADAEMVKWVAGLDVPAPGNVPTGPDGMGTSDVPHTNSPTERGSNPAPGK